MSRSSSSSKWLILYSASTLWIASYYCLLCVSALENEMMVTFNLSNTQFSLFATISFAFAIVSAAFSPHLIKLINLYNAMLLSACLLTIGQILFIAGIIFSDIYVMYLGRIFIGIAYGLDNVTVYSAINIWFGDSKWLTFALNTINSTFELGVLTSRYCMQPLYNFSQQIFVPYVLGVAFGLISISASFVMILVERKFLTQAAAQNEDILSSSSLLESDFRKIKNFNLSVWLMLMIITIGWACDETLYTQFTVPYMTIFKVNEFSANMALSTSSVYALTIGQLWGWFISKYGFVSYWLMFSAFLMSLSLILLFFYDSAAWIISPSSSMWMISVIHVVGLQYFYAVSFTCLYMLCSVEVTSIVNTIACIGIMTVATLESYAFGYIADSTGTYRLSMLMMFVLAICAFISSIMVHFIDINNNGLLHKKSKSKSKAEIDTQNQKSTLKLISDDNCTISHEIQNIDEKDSDENAFLIS